MIIKIKKRDGRTVTFNIEKIASAIYKAAQSVGGSDYEEALQLAGKVVDMLLEERAKAKANKDWATSDKIRNELTALGFEIKDDRAIILHEQPFPGEF